MSKITKGSIEFLTVAIEFCKFIEQCSLHQKDFLDKISKLLPLLYLKASMAETGEPVYDSEPEKFVDEYTYNEVKDNIANILGNKDQYLTAIHPDIALSDSVIAASISEDLADVYQAAKDFVESAKIGDENLLNDALIVCINDFKSYWGTRLLSAELAIHQIITSTDDDTDEPIITLKPAL